MISINNLFNLKNTKKTHEIRISYTYSLSESFYHLPTMYGSGTLTSPYFRNQEANQINIRTVRTKTSGSNNIKSKSANIWKFLQIFINRLFYNWLCLTVPLLFIIYLFFFVCLISVGFTSSCIYVSHGFILYWGTGLD